MSRRSSRPLLRVSARVTRALRAGRPVVALESSVFAQGLPRPVNAEAARRMLRAIDSAGAEPAVTAVVSGTLRVGLGPRDLQRFLSGRTAVPKLSARDLVPAIAGRTDGATTVAAAIVLARQAGIDVFATGGIGGVHRGSGYDESADLLELSRTPIIVVCSGAKAILDLPATAERLETLSVTVVGFRTDHIPAFFTAATRLPVTVRAETVAEIAGMFAVHRRLGRPGALLVVHPPPADAALPAGVVDRAVRRGLRAAARGRVTGPAVTPFLLAAVEKDTGGRSLAANVALLESNARLAAGIAAACASQSR